MKYFKKTSFPVIFLFFFSATLVIFGSLQALSSGLRWYNPSEERHESLSSEKAYLVDLYSASTSSAKYNETIIIYLDKNSAETQKALSTLSPEKAKKIQEKISEYRVLETSALNSLESEVPDPVSPIVLQIRPTKSLYPRGYESMIYGVTTGKYFNETLWDFPVIIDTERVNPRGQMRDESVILSGGIKSIPEATKVFIHELGHMVDLYVLKSTAKKRDPSQIYYNISWSEPTVIRSDMPRKAFIS